MRKLAAALLVLALGACATDTSGGSWNQFAYSSPMNKLNVGAIKTLESPGIY